MTYQLKNTATDLITRTGLVHVLHSGVCWTSSTTERSDMTVSLKVALLDFAIFFIIALASAVRPRDMSHLGDSGINL